MDKSSTMRSLERAIDVLEVLDEARQPLRLTEIARRAGLPVPTAQRILAVLESRDRVERSGAGYRPGVALTFGAHAYLTTNPLLLVASPVLIDLAVETGLTASLFREYHDTRVVLTRAHAQRRLRYELPVGARLPLHLGAGKALLAQRSAEDARALLESLGETAEYPAPDVEAVLADLARTRELGYSVAYNERAPGVASVAAAIPLHGDVRAAVQVAGYTEDVPEARTAALGLEVQRAALAIGRAVPTG
ncbi:MULTISPECIES: IclR family transcriptional regulator [Pseudonocardia]|uniref:IclR family transcriptional regulator n=1 Tax=Pseudonocardia sp. SID8383 TaxID=2690363 RepID=UPI00091B3CB8|nr:IclR family transcriptional regulator [Pseudonocardia sp. SID8383]OJG04361.1 Acetate operon repressor [Pseudonocardia autotrophica]